MRSRFSMPCSFGNDFFQLLQCLVSLRFPPMVKAKQHPGPLLLSDFNLFLQRFLISPGCLGDLGPKHCPNNFKKVAGFYAENGHTCLTP
jgi:hypothetical protein